MTARKRHIIVLTTLCLGLTSLACNEMGSGHSLFGPKKPGDTVLRVICLYIEPVFMSYDPGGDPDSEGFRCKMYLESARTGKGIHANGELTCTIHRMDPDPRDPRKRTGKRIRTLVFEETWPMSNFPRSKSPDVMGDWYGVNIVWGEDLDLTGKEIEISFMFKDTRGEIARSQIKSARVPKVY